MTKKITFLISSLSGGGAEGVCVNVANGLATSGWQVDLVVLHMNNSVYHERLDVKVNLVVLDINHARYSPLGLAKYLLVNKPERLLVFNYELTVVAVVLKKLLRLKIKVMARNINTLSHKRKHASGFWMRYIVQPLVGKFYSDADHIINQCEAMREDLLTVYPKIGAKTSVIYNPINSIVEDYAKNVEFEKINKQEYILCVGRLEQQKAFYYAIEGFAKITDEFPALRLKIVGKGSLVSELKKCVKEFEVEDRVDFEGFQNDIIPYYMGAKATLLTSLYEGFPNVLIESIALATPIIAFDCQSGPSEIIVDGVNGYLVEYQNVDDLSDKIVKSLQTKWNRQKIKDTAEQFKIDYIIEQYINVLENKIVKI
jgi:glycosyltransferase involved in cell wall biosynthesis